MHAQPIHTLASCARLAGTAPAPVRPAVLLADGGADVHAIFGAVLEREGFRVIHAHSRAECLRLASRPLRAALVSVGWCGLLTWRRLHQLADAANRNGFPIICLTTDPRLAGERHGRPPGVSAVLMLPCEPEALAAEVRRAIDDADGQPN